VNRRFLALATLVALSSIAGAQRTRSQADRRTDLFSKDSAPQGPALRVRDVEDQSPIKLLIDKRKDLKLTEPQLSQLKDAENKLKNTNAPLLKAVDSLVREVKSTAGASSDDGRSRARSARLALMAALSDIRTNYDASAKEALAGLDADQQSKGAELLDKQKKDAEKFLQERLGGDRRGGERQQ